MISLFYVTSLNFAIFTEKINFEITRSGDHIYRKNSFQLSMPHYKVAGIEYRKNSMYWDR